MSKSKSEEYAEDVALGRILAERARQDALKAAGKFPKTCADDMPDDRRLAVLTEEMLEVAQAVNDRADGKPVELEHVKAELSQVAAVCLAWLEGLELGR